MVLAQPAGSMRAFPGRKADMTNADDRLRYRLLTGPDDRSFCERISAALDQGYVLAGSPSITHAPDGVIAAQAVVLPDA